MGWVTLYDHYGIYSEDCNSVIHYQELPKSNGKDAEASGSCVDSCGEVFETPLEDFLGGVESFTICRYPKEQPCYPLCFALETFEVRYDTIKDKRAPNREANPKSSGAKVVKKARDCIGKRDYNPVWNNCEHFAVTCRYDYRASGQVQS